MAEGTRLEIACGVKSSTLGSNPSLSANLPDSPAKTVALRYLSSAGRFFAWSCSLNML